MHKTYIESGSGYSELARFQLFQIIICWRHPNENLESFSGLLVIIFKKHMNMLIDAQSKLKQ